MCYSCYFHSKNQKPVSIDLTKGDFIIKFYRFYMDFDYDTFWRMFGYKSRYCEYGGIRWLPESFKGHLTYGIFWGPLEVGWIHYTYNEIAKS